MTNKMNAVRYYVCALSECVQITQTPCTLLHNFSKNSMVYHVALFVGG